MFSGIVQGCFEVVDVVRKTGLISFTVKISNKMAKDLKKGSSVSVDGVCLTVIKINENKISFDAMLETLNKTTLCELKKGDKVNIERSIKAGDEIGGHPVSGHVHSKTEIVKVETPVNNKVVTFKAGKNWIKYIIAKGFISLDGVSLTVVDVEKQEGTFTVYFIPETLKLTTFGFKKEGDYVNMEIDQQTKAIVDTVESVLKGRL